MGGSVLTVNGAFSIFDRWCEDPRVEMAVESKSLESAFRGAALGFGNRAATKAIMDAYLVGFAGSVNATLVTFDKPLSKSAKRGGIDYLQLG